ncbi:hypothetical protein [Parasitella parasitica]|uniref:Myb-like domain-containing protein n=1 Tax=Parasitella parasitica TaxID=35722 RepID=A0A0B7NHM0_9FUNG|nr:hypothetical protein [Parasitella parasitica]
MPKIKAQSNTKNEPRSMPQGTRNTIRPNDSPSLWNMTLSPGWTSEESEALRLAVMKFGIGNWSKIRDSQVLPYKTNAQLNSQLQRLLGQQSTAEFAGLHIDPKVIGEKNAKIQGPGIKRKNNCIVNTGNKLTREELRVKIQNNKEHYELPESKWSAIVLSKIENVESIMASLCFSQRFCRRILKNTLYRAGLLTSIGGKPPLNWILDQNRSGLLSLSYLALVRKKEELSQLQAELKKVQDKIVKLKKNEVSSKYMQDHLPSNSNTSMSTKSRVPSKKATSKCKKAPKSAAKVAELANINANTNNDSAMAMALQAQNTMQENDRIDDFDKKDEVCDGACGKTCLLSVFCKGFFPRDYIPTIFDNSVKDVIVDSETVVAELWDTAGQEDFDRLRTLSYPDSDVVLIAFSVDVPESLENITEKWMPEVKRYCPDLPFLLVGCKTDLRQDQKTIQELEKQSLKPITTYQGKEAAAKVGAYMYVECSAKTEKGVDEVFISAIRSTMKKSSGCSIM